MSDRLKVFLVREFTFLYLILNLLIVFNTSIKMKKINIIYIYLSQSIKKIPKVGMNMENLHLF